jgi:hypothetical protein
MRIPRWLVVAMLTLSLLAMLSAMGWHWLIWPTSTGRTFGDLVHANRWEEAPRMLGPEVNQELISTLRRHPGLSHGDLEPTIRTVVDLLLGRQTFTNGWYEFTVLREKVVAHKVIKEVRVSGGTLLTLINTDKSHIPFPDED